MTLALITNMGAFPSTPAPPTRPSPIARFRGAVLVAIAVSRLALLVRKWKRAFRIGPSEVVHPNGVRYTAGPCITAEMPACQTSIQTWVTQPNTTGRSFSRISQVPLQPVPLAQLQNIGPKK
ncbi:hypothetical protein GJAV_G00212050 [Gymnothorax javanicus]|nr:hypothetical protein GJAV_G00212050 [Gymnothorax javanicus]